MGNNIPEKGNFIRVAWQIFEKLRRNFIIHTDIVQFICQ